MILKMNVVVSEYFLRQLGFYLFCLRLFLVRLQLVDFDVMSIKMVVFVSVLRNCVF